jgi:O-antigen/teichoic acid export membrane protein
VAPDSHKSSLARNSVFNLFGQLVPMAVGFVAIPVVVRGVGTDGFGIVSIAWMLLGYFSVLDLGLSRATVKFVAEYSHPDRAHKIPSLVWTTLSLQVGMGMLGMAGVGAFVPYLVRHVLKMPAALVSQAQWSLLILCAAVPILLCSNALRGVLEAAQRFDLVNAVKVPTSIAFYALALIAVPFHASVVTIVSLSVVSRVIAAVAYFVLALRVYPQLRTRPSFSRGELRHLLSFGGWVMISNAAFPCYAYLERFMIGTVLSVGMLAYYSAPYELISKFTIFPASIAPALFPFFSFHGKEQAGLVSQVSSRTMKYLLFLMTPALAMFLFFAHPILQLWLGGDFAAKSTMVLQVLAVGFFLNALSWVPFTSVQALGRPDLKAALDVAQLPLFVGLSWYLMRHMGITGAAWAKLLLILFDSAFLFIFASRMKAFSIRDCVRGPLARSLLLSLGLLAAVFATSRLGASLPVSILLFAACCALYAVGFWVAAADDKDRGTIRNLPHALLARGKAASAV